ncbi:SMC-Scp complex subunit ScpB [Micromonospora sp. NPDC005806]|uniref:SMC-Scp complex subunit ScpB n=1 Tax=Micromonospora sp. NPDC005806 TaxID=3364234 RepID=UPI0036B102BB
MSDEERHDSLADQAAAWIPPWERPAPPKPEPTEQQQPEPPAQRQPEPAAEAEAEPADATPAPSETAAVLGRERPLEGPTAAEISPPAQVAADLGTETPLAGPVDTRIAEEAEPTGGSDGAVGEESSADEPGPLAGEGDAAGIPEKRGRRRAAPAPEPAPELDDAELRGALEAILLVVDQPVSELTLAQVLEQAPERIGPMLDDIAAGYTAARHGFELRRAAGGWRLYTRPEYATYVERFVLEGQSVRLTQAALETLAVVAYKQPVTRSRISAIRGVNCDGVIRTLVSRGLVEECGTEADSGAFLYRTTTMFLEKLGLNSADELPPLAPFLPDDVEELADAT